MSGGGVGGDVDVGSITGNLWRNNVVEACAQLLGKSLDELRRQYSATHAVKNVPAFTNQSRRTAPRDFSDFVIMSTLETKATKNVIERKHASAWLFNLMDRTGNGYVCREEFERYTPYMSPASDEAVCTDIFASLIAVQKTKEENDNTDNNNKSETASIDCENERLNKIASNRYEDSSDSTADGDNSGDDSNNGGTPKKKKVSNQVSKILVSPDERAIKTRATDKNGTTEESVSSSSAASLYPISMALRYQTWRSYYEKVLDQYYKGHPEWNKVKQLCGIDATEVLIYSEQAMVHAEILPKWGTLFLSQRYIIFYESGTRNHYVARLGAIIDVCKGSISILMRDVFELYLMSDSQSALKGITSVQTRDNNNTLGNNNNTNNNNTNNKNNNRSNEDKLTPQHIEKNMQKFTNGDKPLIFSFSEFMDTSKRDKWVIILKEVIAAHKLHFSMQFGEAGRTSPLLKMRAISEDGLPSPATSGIVSPDSLHGDGNVSNSDIHTPTYYYSPFQNEPSPPLLVIAAHANVARFLALKELVAKKEKDQSNNNINVSLLPEEICLLFSNPNSHAPKIRWYVDSVRKHNRWNDKSFIERLVGSIRNNIEANIRIYSANDDRPFDPQILASGIGRFGELCTPVVRVVQYCNHLFQWENPPASILAILICLFIAQQDLISYIPALLILGQVLFIVEIRMNYFGFDIGRESADEVQEQQRNFFQMLGQVQNGLQAVQNVLTKANVHIGKFQTLFLWRTYEWRSWVIVSIMGGLMLALFIVPARHLFTVLIVFLFARHFLPPQNALLTYWDSIPSHVELKAG